MTKALPVSLPDMPAPAEVRRRDAADVAAGARAEAAALAALREGAALPASASPEIVAAPAAGPRLVAPQHETVLTPAGPRVRRASRDGFHPVRAADAFDLMAARSRHGSPFTPAQEEAGRTYARLTERIMASGYRCASLEAMVEAGRATGGGSWIDALLTDMARLRAMRRAVAAVTPAMVLTARDAAPLRGAHPARPLALPDLVDRVCVAGQTLAEVLAAHGWPVQTRRREVLREALAGALDRLRDL